jgi:hypothetical protein
MRRTLKGFAGCAALVLALAFAGRANAAVCGDLNGNGSRSTADVVLLFRAVLENPDPAPLCGGAGASDCGDINADGGVSTADVVILFSSVLGNETLFPLCTGVGQDIACGSTISGSIASNKRMLECEYTLDGIVFVEPNAVLTITAGATIKGKSSPSNDPVSALVFRRDSKVNAPGTAAKPIIFTCDLGAGSRFPGCWGGVVLNGRAPVNVPGGEGLAEGLNNVPFGGTDGNDSSGLIRFVRVEFAGRILSPNNELNLFTMNAVGRGTTIDHIAVNQGLDDGFEWFGGNVNTKFMAATAMADDGLDWQLGTTGSLQYGYAAHSGINIDTAGSQEFEGDNNENGFDFTPRSKPKFCNVTAVGTRNQAGGNVQNYGMFLRRGTAGLIMKTISVNANTAGMTLRDSATANNACTAGAGALTGELNCQDCIFWKSGPSGTQYADTNAISGGNCNSAQIFGLWTSQATAPTRTIDPGLPANIGEVWPPVSPVPTTAANSNALDCKTVDAFFDTTGYVGAFQPGAASWLSSPWFDTSVN